MSGTSIDGVDAVLADFDTTPLRTRAHAHVAFDPVLRLSLTTLQRKSADELHRAALAANALMDVCAEAVDAVLREAAVSPSEVAAIGVHGQTIRHRPELGYTLQLANPARLAERDRPHRGGRFSQSRRRRRRSGSAAGAGVSRGGVRRRRPPSCDHQSWRHRQHHRPSTTRRGARFRHGSGKYPDGRMGRAP